MTLFNTLTGTRMRLKPHVLTLDQTRALEAGAWPSNVPVPDTPILATLMEHGLVVPDRIDELAIFRRVRARHREDPSLRRVSVILTRKCNLGCGYCYQDKGIGDAPPERERVLAYLLSQIVPQGVLQLHWFGGEPTLRMSDIRALSDAVIPACQAAGTSYSASITTNGTLLDAEKIDTLLSRGVKTFQVSLDGPAVIQERRRPSLTRRPTYESILVNLRRLADRGAAITLKVILDQENYHSVPSLFRDLGHHDLLSRVRIAIQHTEAKFASAGYDKRFESLEAFSDAKLALLRVLVEHGYPLSQPSLHPEFCAATSEYSTQIDMAGNFFRCGTESQNLTGELSPDGTVQRITRPEYESLFVDREFATPDCAGCKVLPICGGGCTIAAEGHAVRDVCSFYRVGVREYLRIVDEQESTREAALGE